MVDSKAGIEAVASNTTPKIPEISESRKMLTILHKQQKHIVLQWIPSHTGIEGNEWADLLAKKDIKISLKSTPSKPIHTIIQEIKTKIDQSHLQAIKTTYKDKKWINIVKENRTLCYLVCKEAVAKFRILTGHNCLAQHLHRIKVLDTDSCTLCNQDVVLNADHLLKCSALDSNRQQAQDISSLYWEATRKMV